jgi:hypothetical protein
VSAFQIIVEPSSLEVHKNGSVTGQIWMMLDGQPFPEPSWNDFALVVLGWWCHTVSDMAPIQGAEGEMRFMDGPFLVNVLVDTEDRLRLVAHTYNARAPVACLPHVDEVRRELVAAGKIVLEFCDLHGIDTDDVRVLRSGVTALQAGAPE